MSLNEQQGKSQLEYLESLLDQAADAEQKNTEEALKYALEALELSKKHRFKKQEARCYVRIGRCHWINGNFNEALENLSQALDITDKINESYTKAEALIGIGNVYLMIELLDQCISHYQNALEITRNHGYDKLESIVLNNMGNMHEDLKNYEVALDFYKQSLNKTIDIDDTYGSAIAYLNIGNVYLSLKDYDESLINIQKAIDYGKENQSILLLAHAFYSMGRLKQNHKEYTESINYILLASEKARESKDSYILFRIYLELAQSYDLINQIESAKHYYEKAFLLSKQIGMVELMPRIHEQMAAFFEKRGEKELSCHHYKSYLESNKAVEENRRIERIKSIEFQSKLSQSMEETRIYRQLSNELRRSYQQMHVLSNIGQAMTSTHQIQDIFQQLYENVNLLMSAESLGVGLYDEELQGLRFDLFIEQGKTLDSMVLKLDNKKSWSVYSFLNKETIKINDSEKEYMKYIEKVTHTRGNLMHSAMYAPLMVEGEVIGVFSIQTREKNAYSDTDMDLLQTLASYLAIAIKNAMKTKELARLNQIFQDLSERDGLTGIPNRRLYDKKYQELWDESIENKEPFSMLMIDIDDFKFINDKSSHMTGDEAIKNVAHILDDVCQNTNNFAARYGGDEFVMILPNCDCEEAVDIAKDILERVKQISKKHDLNQIMTVSIGSATAKPNHKLNTSDFIKKVDEQLYVCKANGKNRVSHTCIR